MEPIMSGVLTYITWDMLAILALNILVPIVPKMWLKRLEIWVRKHPKSIFIFVLAFPWIALFYVAYKPLGYLRKHAYFYVLVACLILVVAAIGLIVIGFSLWPHQMARLEGGFDLLIGTMCFYGIMRSFSTPGGDDDSQGWDEPTPDDPTPYGDAVDRMLRSSLLARR